jgi:hypothetical protein
MATEQTAQHEATCVQEMADAIMRSRECNAIGTAIGLALVSTVVVGQDQIAKTALAIAMLKMIREDLDADVLNAKWN